MPIQIIDSFSLKSDIPLDIRYTAETYFDVSAYWYEGMQVYQYSDKSIWFYDGSIWQPISSSSSPFNVLFGGRIGLESTDDVFNGNVTIGDVLYGGNY